MPGVGVVMVSPIACATFASPEHMFAFSQARRRMPPHDRRAGPQISPAEGRMAMWVSICSAVVPYLAPQSGPLSHSGFEVTRWTSLPSVFIVHTSGRPAMPSCANVMRVPSGE
jgi:hypothetical protein